MPVPVPGTPCTTLHSPLLHSSSSLRLQHGSAFRFGSLDSMAVIRIIRFHLLHITIAAFIALSLSLTLWLISLLFCFFFLVRLCSRIESIYPISVLPELLTNYSKFTCWSNSDFKVLGGTSDSEWATANIMLWNQEASEDVLYIHKILQDVN